MKRHGLVIFLGSLLLIPGILHSAPGRSLSLTFREANRAYQGGSYAQAASLYESLLKQGLKYAVVHYNLGNAYFKQNQLGRALLHYERARRLAPRDRDISTNLNFARGLLEYRIDDKRNWYLKAADALLRRFTTAEIRFVSFGLGLLFWLGWAFLLYFRGGASWGWRQKTVALLWIIALSLWGTKEIHSFRMREAIVLKSEAAVRYGPSYKDRVALKLVEGMKVRVEKNVEDWQRVVLVNGETGWMSKEEVKEI